MRVDRLFFGRTTGSQALPSGAKILLIGESFSLFGGQVSVVVLPLIAVLTLRADELTVGILSAAAWLPILIFGLLAGSLVDRWNRWKILSICNFCRACLLSYIPLAYLLGILNISALVSLAFLVGAFNVFFDIAYQTYVPELVQNELLGKANNILELVRSIAQLSAPLCAGLVATWQEPPLAIGFTVATFIVAFASLQLMPKQAKYPVNSSRQLTINKAPMLDSVLEGVRMVWQHRVLRLVVLSGTVINLFVSGAATLTVLYVTSTLNMDPAVFGMATAFAGFGSLLGASSYRFLSLRLREGQCIALGILSLAVGTLLLYTSQFLTQTLIILFLAEAIIGFGSPVMNIALVTLRQKVTPGHILGRVNGAARVMIMSTLPLGALMFGSIADSTTTSFAILLSGILQSLTFLVFLRPLLSSHSGR